MPWVYINKKEAEAIFSGWDMISTAMEGACEEFCESYKGDAAALNRLRDKILQQNHKRKTHDKRIN